MELTYSTPPDILAVFKESYSPTSKGTKDEGGQGLGKGREGKGERAREGERGRWERREAWGGERKAGRGMEGINLPHGRLKTLAAL